MLAPYTEGTVPAGVKRYTFSPDAAYAKKLKAFADPNEVPGPPCGDCRQGSSAHDGLREVVRWMS